MCSRDDFSDIHWQAKYGAVGAALAECWVRLFDATEVVYGVAGYASRRVLVALLRYFRIAAGAVHRAGAVSQGCIHSEDNH